MSINSIINIGVSGLQTAQTGLRVTSDNISNVNTPGYVRKLVDQRSLAFDGRGQGVEASRVRLAVDRFLQAANLNAWSDAGRASASAELYDRAQSYFGDPSSDSDLFSRLDKVFSAFSATASDPSSGPARQASLTAVQGFFADADRIAAGLKATRAEADSRIGSAVSRVNDLLGQIETLNVEISRQTVAGRDAAGAQGVQAQLIDELATLVDVKVQERPQGGLFLRTGSGMLLAGQGAASLRYAPSTSGGQGGYGEVTITPPGGQARPLVDNVKSGEIRGLLDLRDTEIAELSRRLSSFVGDAAKTLNAAHNAGSAVPAPPALNGRNIGLDLPTAVSGFTGRTSVAITDAGGVLQRRVDIDFDAGTMRVDGGAAAAFTPGSFLSDLNGALSPLGGASFSGGALSLTAAGGRGVSVGDEASAPTLKAGKSFSGFFGLNDLVRSGRITDFDTGLRPTDPHGFSAGAMTFRLMSASGSPLKDVTVNVTAGGDMNALRAQLNSPSSGLGLYGGFELDANGRLAFTPSTTPGVGFSVVADDTARGAGGPSVSALFGLGSTTPADLASGFAVDPAIAANPRRLALGRLDLSAAAGRPVLAAGDSRNALALAAAGDLAAGGAMSLSRRASDFSGAIGATAQAAGARREAALALAEEVATQRSSAEGVNLDEELVKLTTYQQAFNASSRLIQAAKDMYDVLLAM